eukprot:6186903-Karenia_brevis.AAC.1
MEFTKSIRLVQLPSGRRSSHAGTQAVDVTWKTLDATLPQQLHTQKDHKLNSLLENYVWCLLYRINHSHQDGFETMGSYIKNETI